MVLRPWREEDREELQRLFRDPAVRGDRNMPPEPPHRTTPLAA